MAKGGRGKDREEEHEECENGPSNRINPRPVNPFIGAANPATGYERGCLLAGPGDSRADIPGDGDRNTNLSISKSLLDSTV